MLSYDEKQQLMFDTLAELDTEQALQAILRYHGWQILDEGFFQNLIDEGYIEEQYSDNYEENEES